MRRGSSQRPHRIPANSLERRLTRLCRTECDSLRINLYEAAETRGSQHQMDRSDERRRQRGIDLPRLHLQVRRLPHRNRTCDRHSSTTRPAHHPLQEELQKRGITYQSAALQIQETTPESISENTKSTHTVSFAPTSHHQSPFLPTTTINDHPQPIANDNSNLNYFDASLLTRLELPSFAGNMLEFPEFWARYSALIHCKTTISDATKFSLLKSCLKGRALHTIDGLPITNENYATAIDILLSIYDNPSTLRHLIYTQLLSLPQCDSDGKQLQELYLAMLRLVRQYTAITPDSPEFGLGALLYNKLPRFVKARIYDITGGQKNLTPSELMTLLAEIVRKESTLRQIDASTTSHQLSYHISTKFGRQSQAPPERHLGNRSYRTTSSLDSTRSCPFCKRSSHSAIYCRTVKSPQERRKFAKASKMCLKCLQQGHRTILCNRPPCHQCQYHHHPALCFKTVNPGSSFVTQNRTPSHHRPHPNRSPPNPTPYPNIGETTHRTRTNPATPDPTNTNPTQRGPTRPSQQIHFSNEITPIPTPTKPPEHPETNESPSTYTASQCIDDISGNTSSSEAPVLLMCTTITLMNPNDNSKKVDTVAFLDSGSSHTYITTEIAEKLELHHATPETITLHTFGTSSPTTLKSHLHTVQIQLSNETPYTISAQSFACDSPRPGPSKTSAFLRYTN
ncbi:peptidase family A16 [Ostertagia ostertagi]